MLRPASWRAGGGESSLRQLGAQPTEYGIIIIQYGKQSITIICPRESAFGSICTAAGVSRTMCSCSLAHTMRRGRCGALEIFCTNYRVAAGAHAQNGCTKCWRARSGRPTHSVRIVFSLRPEAEADKEEEEEEEPSERKRRDYKIFQLRWPAFTFCHSNSNSMASGRFRGSGSSR